MRGVIPPLPNSPSWRGAQLKAQGQLYLLPYEHWHSSGQFLKTAVHMMSLFLATEQQSGYLYRCTPTSTHEFLYCTYCSDRRSVLLSEVT
jgi:hypothetical protein